MTQNLKTRVFGTLGPKICIFSLSTQVWQQNPDISLLLNLYCEFKFEVCFDLGPVYNPKPQNSVLFSTNLDASSIRAQQFV